MDVAAWLRGVGLGQYEGVFRESEIEADVLPELTDADLEKLGLPLGLRKRIFKAITNLGGAPKASGAISVSKLKHAIFSFQFMNGSPKGSVHLISRALGSS